MLLLHSATRLQVSLLSAGCCPSHSLGKLCCSAVVPHQLWQDLMVRSVCQSVETSACQLPRRAVLISLGATWLLPVQQAKAGKPQHGSCIRSIECAVAAVKPPALLVSPQCDFPAFRTGFGWDGESAALGSCALGEAGDECRRNVLLYVITHPTSALQTRLSCLPSLPA